MQAGVFLSFVLLVAYSANGESPNPKNVTLIVLGRSGTGISSSIRQIIGSKKTIIAATGPRTLIQEFKVPIPGQQRSLKIIDVDGFVDGQTVEHDALVMSSLKSYLSGSNEVSSPFFVVVSTFDDNRLEGENSLFTQALKRVEMLQKALYKDTIDNTVFLLTKFMTATRSIQRKPNEKIQLFHNTILDYTEFKKPIEIVVGENLPGEYNLEVDRGYTKLPNRDLYPENLFNKLIAVATNFRDLDGAQGIRDFVENRDSSGQVYSRYYENDANDQAEFIKKIRKTNSGAEDNDVNRAVEAAYDRLDASTKAQAASAMIELQTFLQSNGITAISQLPQNFLSKVKFFQSLGGLNSQKLILLQAAFGLSMPDLIQQPVVGYGYDVLQDMSLQTTPFLENSVRPSPIGYLIPDFLACSTFSNPDKIDYTYFSETVGDYLPLRYQFLGLQGEEVVSEIAFDGAVKSGFNLRPEVAETVVSLSAVQEIRTVECSLNDASEVSKEFADSVNELTPFNPSDRDSETTWKAFFRRYGTHVVSGGYGGGYLEGSITSPSLKQVVTSNAEINDTLRGIVNFGNFRFSEKPSYRLFGGTKDSQLENVYELTPTLRAQLMQSWTDSLKYDPIVLQYELRLTPISVFAKQVDQNLGIEVERAAQLLLRGNLIYQRRGKPPPANRPTSRPYVPSTPVAVRSTETPSTVTPSYSSYSSSYQPSPTIIPTYPYPQSPTDSTHKSQPCITQVFPSVIPVPQRSNSVPIPTPSPKREVDYIVSTVGQGYHMLKDIVLEQSPFWFGSLRDKGQGIKIVPLNKSCEIINAKSHASQSQYIQSRLAEKFKLYNIPPNVSKNFKGKILPGNFVKDIHSKRRFKWEVERRIEQLKINDTEPLHTQTTKDFESEVLALPEFISYPGPDCNGRKMWKAFFNKFGTHYVKSTFVGYSYEVTMNNVSEEEGFRLLPRNYAKCERNYTSNRWEGNLAKSPTDVLKPTFEFESYSHLLRWNASYLTPSFDEAIYQLMDNDLACKT